jgi:hypothetical protein
MSLVIAGNDTGAPAHAGKIGRARQPATMPTGRHGDHPMIVSRLAYFLIAGIIATAGVLIWQVLNPGEAENNPNIALDDVINYSRFGVVETIEVRERSLIVTFAEDFDTESAFSSDSRTYEAALPPGRSITSMLQEAGVTIGDGGVRVETQ